MINLAAHQVSARADSRFLSSYPAARYGSPSFCGTPLIFPDIPPPKTAPTLTLHTTSLPTSPRRLETSSRPRMAHMPPASPRTARPLIPPTPRPLTSMMATIDPPRPMAAILALGAAKLPAAGAEAAKPHPSTLVPVMPSPRPATNRKVGAREMPADTLELLLSKPAGGGPNSAASGQVRQRPTSPLLTNLPEPPAESHEEAWADFRIHIYRRLVAGTDGPPPPEPTARKPPRRRKKRRPKREGAAEAETGASADGGSAEAAAEQSWGFRITSTLQQMAAKSHMKMMDVFRKYDSDGSGHIDQFEFEAAIAELGLLDVPPYAARAVFEEYDADGSGSLDMEELATMIKAGRGPSKLDPLLAAGAVDTGTYMPQAKRIGSQRANHRQMEAALQRLQDMDADGDGSADLQEVLAFLLAMFRLGFWPSALVMLIGASLYLTRERTTRNIRMAIIVPICISIVAFLVFTQVFYVPFPESSWFAG